MFAFPKKVVFVNVPWRKIERLTWSYYLSLGASKGDDSWGFSQCWEVEVVWQISRFFGSEKSGLLICDDETF